MDPTLCDACLGERGNEFVIKIETVDVVLKALSVVNSNLDSSTSVSFTISNPI